MLTYKGLCAVQKDRIILPSGSNFWIDRIFSSSGFRLQQEFWFQVEVLKEQIFWFRVSDLIIRPACAILDDTLCNDFAGTRSEIATISTESCECSQDAKSRVLWRLFSQDAKCDPLDREREFCGFLFRDSVTHLRPSPVRVQDITLYMENDVIGERLFLTGQQPHGW